jgi:hypothetical protein
MSVESQALALLRAATVGRYSSATPDPCAGDCSLIELKPDHSTIAEFRCRHQAALAGLFADVLGVWARAGLPKLRVGPRGTRTGPRVAGAPARRGHVDVAPEPMLGRGCATLRGSDSEGNQRARPSSERPLAAKAA